MLFTVGKHEMVIVDIRSVKNKAKYDAVDKSDIMRLYKDLIQKND